MTAEARRSRPHYWNATYQDLCLDHSLGEGADGKFGESATFSFEPKVAWWKWFQTPLSDVKDSPFRQDPGGRPQPNPLFFERMLEVSARIAAVIR